MTDPATQNPGAAVVLPAEGVTDAERYLAKLCKRSFLSIWSYPGVYRDQGRVGGKGDGKEVCDLLVVFENHIIIFSDKDCRFGDGVNLQVEWARWFKKAVQGSARQVWGAERWIKRFPDCLFLDRKCTVPFPIDLPDPAKAIVHRIVVAHDASSACREKFGGSGSMMLDNSLVGDIHLSHAPFVIGQVDPDRGYVHVFDDTTLDIVMNTLDTITDFTSYLTKKERFLTGKRFVHAAGEEELLAAYLANLNDSREHDFIFDGDYDLLSFQEGLWDSFVGSPERHAQIESDRISYSWDALIEKFSFHAMNGTQYFNTGQPLREQEIIFRFLAREPRTRRRLLAASLHEVLERSIDSTEPWEARVMETPDAGFPHYVFLFVRRKPGETDEEYRNIRANLLLNYCRVAKLRFPRATDVVGIASEAGLPPQRSEDLVCVDVSRWSPKDVAEAKEIQKEFGLLRKVSIVGTREYEYPVNSRGRRRVPSRSRNSPCPCGSGKRYKRCHGKDLVGKKRGRRSR
jgi:hypothetical protein